MRRFRSYITFRRALTTWIIIFTAATGYSIREARIQAQRNNQARVALCAFKQDLKRRADQSSQFLKDHPNGAFGIPASTIKINITNQQRTISSLRSLKCKD